MLGDISYIKLLYNPRVNIVFTFTFTQMTATSSPSLPHGGNTDTKQHPWGTSHQVMATPEDFMRSSLDEVKTAAAYWRLLKKASGTTKVNRQARQRRTMEP